MNSAGSGDLNQVSTLNSLEVPEASKGTSDGGDTDLDCSDGEEWMLKSPSERNSTTSESRPIVGAHTSSGLDDNDYVDSDDEAGKTPRAAHNVTNNITGASRAKLSGEGLVSNRYDSAGLLVQKIDGFAHRHGEPRVASDSEQGNGGLHGAVSRPAMDSAQQVAISSSSNSTVTDESNIGPMSGTDSIRSKFHVPDVESGATSDSADALMMDMVPPKPVGSSDVVNSVSTKPRANTRVADVGGRGLNSSDVSMATSDALHTLVPPKPVGSSDVVNYVSTTLRTNTRVANAGGRGLISSDVSLATSDALRASECSEVDSSDNRYGKHHMEYSSKQPRETKETVVHSRAKPGATVSLSIPDVPLSISSQAERICVEPPVPNAGAQSRRRATPSPEIRQSRSNASNSLSDLPYDGTNSHHHVKRAAVGSFSQRTAVRTSSTSQSRTVERNDEVLAPKAVVPLVEDASDANVIPEGPTTNVDNISNRQRTSSRKKSRESVQVDVVAGEQELQPGIEACAMDADREALLLSDGKASSAAALPSSSSSSSSLSSSEAGSSEEEVEGSWQAPIVRLPLSASEPASYSTGTLNRLWPRLDTFHRQILNWKPVKDPRGSVHLVNDLAEKWEQSIRDDYQASSTHDSASTPKLPSSSSSSSSSSASATTLKAELLRYRGRLMRLFFNECFHRANAETRELFGSAGKHSKSKSTSFTSKATVTRIAVDDRGSGDLAFLKLVLPRNLRRTKPFPGDLLLLSELDGTADEKSSENGYFSLGIVPQFNPWMPLDLEAASALLERRLENRPRSGSAQEEMLYKEPANANDILWVCVRASDRFPARLTVNFLASLQTESREFQALQSADHLSLWVKQALASETCLPAIAQGASPQNDKARPPSIPSEIWDALRARFNPAQIRAISCASRGSPTGCTIIQGPPGTGKSTTVLGVLSAFLAGAVPAPPKGISSSNASSSSEATFGAAQVGGKAAKVVAGSTYESRRASSFDETSPNIARNMHDLRVLVCAPSNRALDELVSKIQTNGLTGRQGQKWVPNVVRHGHQASFRETELDNMDENRRGLSQMAARINLETLVELRMRKPSPNPHDHVAGRGGPTGASSTHKKLNNHAEKVVAHTPFVTPAAIRRQVLRDAHIVATTLSGAGSKDIVDAVLEGYLSFDAVVVDEAAFATEPSSLIPLKYLLGFSEPISTTKGMVTCPAPGLSATLGSSSGVRAVSKKRAADNAGAASLSASLVLIGDPVQLSPILFAPTLVPGGLSISLMERLHSQYLRSVRGNHEAEAVVMLNEQYRMHPDIVRWPSNTFYDGRLVTGDRSVSAQETSLLSALFSHPLFAPYLVHDLSFSTEEMTSTGSKSNTEEARYVASLVVLAAQLMSSSSQRSQGAHKTLSIGVIAPYARQVDVIRSSLTKALQHAGSNFSLDVEVSTVDSFQGREKDIIILSCTRAAQEAQGRSSSHHRKRVTPSTIGFLKDPHRLNVAFTRAKHCFLVVCNSQPLRTDPNWSAMLHDASSRGLLEYWRDKNDARAGMNAGGRPRTGVQMQTQQQHQPPIAHRDSDLSRGPSSSNCHVYGQPGHRSSSCLQGKGKGAQSGKGGPSTSFRSNGGSGKGVDGKGGPVPWNSGGRGSFGKGGWAGSGSSKGGWDGRKGGWGDGKGGKGFSDGGGKNGSCGKSGRKGWKGGDSRTSSQHYGKGYNGAAADYANIDSLV